MKFVYCDNCKDIFVPQPKKKKCHCGLTAASTIGGITHVSGQYAVAMNFKDEWFSKTSKGIDTTAVLIGSAIVGDHEERDFCIKVIEYLNHVAGTAYMTKFPSKASGLILQRRKECTCGLDDFKAVIDKKWMTWKGTDSEVYMRPETLFGTKFSTYLGQKQHGQTTKSTGNPSATSRSVKSLLSRTASTGEAGGNVAGQKDP